VVAVGRVSPDDARAMGLPFPVLSDPDLAVARKYGLVHDRGMMFQDVARPATLILDPDRMIRWMRPADHIRSRPTPEEILEELRR
jgi:peroxiredoxin